MSHSHNQGIPKTTITTAKANKQKKTGLTARNFGKIRVKMNENEC